MNRLEWANSFCTEGDFPITTPNTYALLAWMVAEGSEAENNPLDTTEPGYGSTSDFNSTGVKNYPTTANGLSATLDTLRNGDYPAIIAALDAGISGSAVAEAVHNSPWGTKNITTVLAGMTDAQLEECGNVTVTGSGTDTVVPTPPAQKPTPAPVVDTAANGHPELQEGSSGQSVKTVQALLNEEYGTRLVVDGLYGPQTKAQVEVFQSGHGLTKDGIVGPLTWAKLIGG